MEFIISKVSYEDMKRENRKLRMDLEQVCSRNKRLLDIEYKLNKSIALNEELLNIIIDITEAFQVNHPDLQEFHHYKDRIKELKEC